MTKKEIALKAKVEVMIDELQKVFDDMDGYIDCDDGQPNNEMRWYVSIGAVVSVLKKAINE